MPYISSSERIISLPTTTAFTSGLSYVKMNRWFVITRTVSISLHAYNHGYNPVPLLLYYILYRIITSLSCYHVFHLLPISEECISLAFTRWVRIKHRNSAGPWKTCIVAASTLHLLSADVQTEFPEAKSHYSEDQSMNVRVQHTK
jgi:hypothetical protein